MIIPIDLSLTGNDEMLTQVQEHSGYPEQHMKATKCEHLVAAYVEWLRRSITTADVNGVCEITTPFLDRHNDHIQIYVKQIENGFRLSDDGYIINDLEMCGCALDTPARQKVLKTILNGFAVHESNGELYIDASATDFPRKKHLLIQAMLAVNDMFMTSKRSITSLFLEDVQKFLDDNNIRHTPSVEFTGHSGFIHRFDFVIPKSRQAPERLVKAINHPTHESVSSVLWAWTDTKAARPVDSHAYVILNDSEKPIKSDIVTAFQQYEIKPIAWSGINNSLADLVA